MSWWGGASLAFMVSSAGWRRTWGREQYSTGKPIARDIGVVESYCKITSPRSGPRENMDRFIKMKYMYNQSLKGAHVDEVDIEKHRATWSGFWVLGSILTASRTSELEGLSPINIID